MREAMFPAEVGDDVYGEDPTVNRLEASSAEIFGKEAALFVPTGTMGNTIAIKLHTEHGQEISANRVPHTELRIVDDGVVRRMRRAADPDARRDTGWEQIRAEIRPLGPHAAPTGLIEVENTHNMAGGTVYPLETLREHL